MLYKGEIVPNEFYYFTFDKLGDLAKKLNEQIVEARMRLMNWLPVYNTNVEFGDGFHIVAMRVEDGVFQFRLRYSEFDGAKWYTSQGILSQFGVEAAKALANKLAKITSRI